MRVIKNVPITIGPYTYPNDFVVIDMPIDSYCPIIFERTFLNTAGANIDCRKETISLKFGEEVVSFHFSKFTHKLIIEDIEEDEFEEEVILANLSAILYDTPGDDLEVSLLGNENVMIGLDKSDTKKCLVSLPITDNSTNEKYAAPERKGDKDLPPPELKHLPPDLKYRFLDETNKYPGIVSTNLSENGRRTVNDGA
jgi:hypothetical protein